MDNVYDIKIQKNLNFVLPLNQRLKNENIIDMKKVVIIIHLYYEETLDIYLDYIKNITNDIRIFITTSNSKVEEKLYNQEIVRYRNCTIIKKLNRGRDISSILVACREEILQYEFVCFLHDKREKNLKYKDDIQIWIHDLWKNTIGSKEYIDNVLFTFYENPQIGLLVPPPPLGDSFNTAYKNTWYSNFKNTRELIEKMNLHCSLDENKSPITLGTVFWAKVSALKKLFDIKWKYEDFDDEPMKSDGTISHAIERSLAYIAQDAGYETGWVMTDRYAGEKLDYFLSVLRNAFRVPEIDGEIFCNSEVITYEKREKEVLEFVNRFDSFYIYGAGSYGKKCLYMLRRRKKIPRGFIVSNKENNKKNIEGIPVYALPEIDSKKYFGIIIAMHDKYRQEVLRNLTKEKFDFERIYEFEKD